MSWTIPNIAFGIGLLHGVLCVFVVKHAEFNPSDSGAGEAA
jgi:glycerol uptake facilitator-like aquaporin